MSGFEIHEQAQQSAMAAHLADVMAREVKQSDTDRLIQYSTYGYAEWGYLMAWRTPAAGPTPGKQPVIASASPDWVCQVESDDPAGEQTNYLHHAYANQNLDSVGCRVNISDECTNSDDTQLFMQRGEVVAYWSCCTTCHSWLSAMAHAECEPINGDPQRRAKHILEVLKTWGEVSVDLSSYMRDEDPVKWARRVYGQG